MTHSPGRQPHPGAEADSRIAVISVVVFVGLMAMGLQLPVLPLHVLGRLGFDVAAIGWVMALQSMATLVTRPWAGGKVDRRGTWRAVGIGLLAITGSGGVYALAALVAAGPEVGLSLIATGRVLTGVGEGLIVTGAGAWAVGLAGTERVGWAMSWIGLAMFAGLAAGTAIGAMVDLQGMAILIILAAGIGLALTTKVPTVAGSKHEARPKAMDVLRWTWRPGLSLGLSAVGFAAVSSFSALLFHAKGWDHQGSAAALFGIGHVAARLLLARLPDRKGNASAVLLLILVEVLGLVLLSLASLPAIALTGAALEGFGFSMVYPVMAVRLLRSVPDHARGTAVGIYDAFFDVAMGAAGVACGLVAQRTDLQVAFLFAALVVAASGLAVMRTLQSRNS